MALGAWFEITVVLYELDLVTYLSPGNSQTVVLASVTKTLDFIEN